MSNIQTGAERMPHDLSHLGFLAGQIGRLITISTTPVIAGDSFEMDAVGALRLSPLQIGRASCREKSVDLGGRRIIKKKKKKSIVARLTSVIVFPTSPLLFTIEEIRSTRTHLDNN